MKKYVIILIGVAVLLAGVLIAQGQSDSKEKTKKKPDVNFIPLTEEQQKELDNYVKDFDRVMALKDEVASLYGVKEFIIVVENIDEGGKRLGLDRETIQTKAEVKLRIAGINVISKEEAIKKLDLSPFLYIRAQTFPIFKESYTTQAFITRIDLQFKQMVELKRITPKPIMYAITWDECGMLNINSLEKIDMFYDYLATFIDEFINDYLKANPKK